MFPKKYTYRRKKKKKQGSDLVLAYHHWLERDGEKNNNIKEALCQSVHKEVSRVLCTSKQITEKKKRFALRHRCLKAKCTREAFVRDAKFVQNSQFCFFMHDPWHVYQLCWVEKLGINVKKVKKKEKTLVFASKKTRHVWQQGMQCARQLLKRVIEISLKQLLRKHASLFTRSIKLAGF